MNPLVQRYLKTAVAFLAAGLTIGFWMMWRREMAGQFPSLYVTSAHTHAILVGFVMMMIMGVALWMFPRPAREDRRFSPRVAEGAYWCVTVGTTLRVAGELMHARSDAAPLRWVVLTGGLLQIAGLLAFFSTMWTRIRTTIPRPS